MAVSAKIKLLRVLSVLQCWIAVWLVVLGIVEVIRVNWLYSGLGMTIWTGAWVGVTGAFGVFITFKCVQNLSYGSVIAPHLVMTLMGFSLTCGILSTLFLFLYSYELSSAGQKKYRQYTSYDPSGGAGDKDLVVRNWSVHFDSRDTEEHALVGSIFGFFVVELLVAMWSVAICNANDQHQLQAEDEPCEVPLIRSSSNRGQDGKSVASRLEQMINNCISRFEQAINNCTWATD